MFLELLATGKEASSVSSYSCSCYALSKAVAGTPAWKGCHSRLLQFLLLLCWLQPGKRCGAHHPAYKEHVRGMCHLLRESTVLAARLLSTAGSQAGRERQNEENSMKLVSNYLEDMQK